MKYKVYFELQLDAYRPIDLICEFQRLTVYWPCDGWPTMNPPTDLEPQIPTQLNLATAIPIESLCRNQRNISSRPGSSLKSVLQCSIVHNHVEVRRRPNGQNFSTFRCAELLRLRGAQWWASEKKSIKIRKMSKMAGNLTYYHLWSAAPY